MSQNRADGRGYIDQPESRPVPPPIGHAPSVSGSSVEEEVEDNDASLVGGEISYPSPRVDQTSKDLLEAFDRVFAPDDGDLDSDYNDYWDVDEEDWELAHGDFTKQYNRLRQQHAAAVNPSAASHGFDFDQPGPSSFKPPLPARNVNREMQRDRKAAQSTKKVVNPALLASGGVAANPKSNNDRPSKDKSDRATTEQVLDARTRLVLAGLVNRGIIGKVERCVSTGKEANVYHAISPAADGGALAVKIYRTSILNFRARQNYIVGEHRFRGEYSSSRNPRKMVRVWAEKEMRNLRRLEQYAIRAPRVVEGKENVLVMEFLSSGDSASPRLKDAKIPDGRLPKLYAELLVTVRRMFQDCRLVHADLSEYNILYHASHLYIIDVSQSVEHDHPRAFDFLRSDLHNVEEFFGKHSVPTLGIRRVWDFVTSETVAGITRGDENGVEGEGRLMEVVRCWLENTLKQDLALSYGGLGTSSGAPDVGNEDAVFKSSYIPRNLGDVYDPERDIEVVNAGRADTLIYARLTGLEESTQVPIVHRSSTDGEHGDEGSSGEEQTCTGTDSGDEASAPLPGSRSRGFRHEDKNARKERKKAVKEEKRERRKQKMPKSQKQKLIKRSSGK